MPRENPRVSTDAARKGAAGVKTAVAGAILALGLVGGAAAVKFSKPQRDPFPGTEFPVGSYGGPLLDSYRAEPGRVLAAIPPRFDGVRAYAVVRNPQGAKAALLWFPQIHDAAPETLLAKGPLGEAGVAEIEGVVEIQRQTYSALRFLCSRFAITRVGLEGTVSVESFGPRPEEGLFRPGSLRRDLSTAYGFGAAWRYRDALGWWAESEDLFKECAAPVERLGGRSTPEYAKLLELATSLEILNDLHAPRDARPMADALWLDHAYLDDFERPKGWRASDDELARKVRRAAQKFCVYAKGAGGTMAKQGYFKAVPAEDFDVKVFDFEKPYKAWCAAGAPESGPAYDAFHAACERRETKSVELLAAEGAVPGSSVIPFQYGCRHSFTDNVDAYNAAHPDAPYAFAVALPEGLDVSSVADPAARAALQTAIAQQGAEER